MKWYLIGISLGISGMSAAAFPIGKYGDGLHELIIKKSNGVFKDWSGKVIKIKNEKNNIYEIDLNGPGSAAGPGYGLNGILKETSPNVLSGIINEYKVSFSYSNNVIDVKGADGGPMNDMTASGKYRPISQTGEDQPSVNDNQTTQQSQATKVDPSAPIIKFNNDFKERYKKYDRSNAITEDAAKLIAEIRAMAIGNITYQDALMIIHKIDELHDTTHFHIPDDQFIRSFFYDDNKSKIESLVNDIEAYKKFAISAITKEKVLKNSKYGVISGNLPGISKGMPTRITARNLDDNHTYYIDTISPFPVHYKIDQLPPGKYVIVAYPKMEELLGSNVGLISSFNYSILCNSSYNDFSLVPVLVKAGIELTNVNLYLSDEKNCRTWLDKSVVGEIAESLQKDEDARQKKVIEDFKASPAYKRIAPDLLRDADVLISKILINNSMDRELKSTISPDRARVISQRMVKYQQTEYVPAIKKFTDTMNLYVKWNGQQEFLEFADRHHNLKTLLTQKWNLLY